MGNMEIVVFAIAKDTCSMQIDSASLAPPEPGQLGTGRVQVKRGTAEAYGNVPSVPSKPHPSSFLTKSAIIKGVYIES